jgi:hypothetical protein
MPCKLKYACSICLEVGIAKNELVMNLKRFLVLYLAYKNIGDIGGQSKIELFSI